MLVGLIRKSQIAAARDNRTRGTLDLLPFRLLRVIQIGTSDASYDLVIDQGGGDERRVEIGETSVLRSPTLVGNRLFEQGHVLTRQIQKAWPRILEAMLELVQVEEVPTENDTWMDFLTRRLDAWRSIVIGYSDPLFGGPEITLQEAFASAYGGLGVFDMQGRLYVRTVDLIKLAQEEIGQGVTQRVIGRRLRRLGFTLVAGGKLRVGLETGGQTQMRVWASSEGLFADRVKSHRDALASTLQQEEAGRASREAPLADITADADAETVARTLLSGGPSAGVRVRGRLIKFRRAAEA